MLLCDDGNLEPLPLCRKHGFGIEMQAFSNPMLYEHDPSVIVDHLEGIEGIKLRAVHGCYRDLCPGSFDPMVRGVAGNRFDLSYRATAKLKAQHLILHHGYVPHTSHPDRWITRCTAFWKEFLYDKDTSISIHVENLLELEPQLLADVIDAIDSPVVDTNLDIGHAYCNSRKSIMEWIQVLGKRIGYVHLHDNNGKEDEHLRFGEGSIPLTEVMSALEQSAPEAYWAIETEIAGLGQSIQWIMENFEGLIRKQV